MSFDRENEQTMNGFHDHHGHLFQQHYNSAAAPPLNLQRPNLNSSSAPTAQPASSSAGAYPFPMYSNNTFTRYPASMGHQKLTPQQQQQQQQQQQHGPPVNPPTPGIPINSMTSMPDAVSMSAASMVPNASSHVARQLTFAQISRQSSSPHHHARTAAAMARNAPVSSVVTISDPNNPAKSFHDVLGKNKADENGRMGSKPPTASLTSSNGAQTWTTLDMGGMRLKNLSPAVCNYTFLTTLYINHNNFVSLPPAIANLAHLRVLDVSGNNLTSFPPELGLLIQLRELLAFDNNIVTLPSELGTLYQLEILGLEGNPLDPQLKNILLKEGTPALIMWLKENAQVGMPPPQREWVHVESEEGVNESDKFTVFSFNMLCKHYATPQSYGYTPMWALNWEYRKELIFSEILKRSADIVCLQEVEYREYEQVFRDELKTRGGYNSVFYPKTRAKTMSEPERSKVDGCATFFKESRFTLLQAHLLEYNQNALKRSDFKSSADIYNRVMTKDNIAVMVVLENNETKGRLLVANSHVHWDPTLADVKLVQVGMLMDEVEKLASKHLAPPASSPDGVTYSSTSALPTIIAGDFNSTPDSGVYEFLSKGAVKQDHNDFGDHRYGSYTTDGLSHKLSLKSTHAPIGELPFTNYTPGFKGVLDYIWCTTNTLEVLSVLGTIDSEYLSKVVGFPNAHFPSDHIPIMAKLKVKSPRVERKEKAVFDSTQRYTKNSQAKDDLSNRTS